MLRRFTYLIAISLVATLFSCSGSKSGDSHNIDLEKISGKKEVKLTADNDSPVCTAAIDIEFAKGGKVEKLINEQIIARLFDLHHVTPRQAVDSFLTQYCDIYKKDCKMFYDADRRSEITIDKKLYNYTYSLQSKTVEKKDGIISFCFDESRYEGGQDVVTMEYWMNFDKSSGKLITYNDLFISSYERKLEDALFNALLEKTGAKNKAELNEKGYLQSVDMYAPENFLLTDDNIIFYYNKGEIAPFSEGVIALEVDYDELKDILK